MISVALLTLLGLPTLAQSLGLVTTQSNESKLMTPPPGESLSATQLTIPEAMPAGSMPTRGMTMQQVEQSHGAPLVRKAPVGDPPITRWEYEGFVVYFEYRHVIHSVTKVNR